MSFSSKLLNKRNMDYGETMKEPAEEVTALVSLSLANLEFQNKIKELNAYHLSLQDALDQDDTALDDNKMTVLQGKLMSLAQLKQKYEDLVTASIISSGARLDPSINEAFREAVDAYYNLKPNVESLIRRLKRTLAADLDIAREDDYHYQESGTNESKGKIGRTKKDDEVVKESVENKEERNVTGRKDKEEVPLTKSICKGIVIFIGFYACLAVVINLVLKDNQMSAVTGEYELSSLPFGYIIPKDMTYKI